MITIQANPVKNLLIVKLEGCLSEKDLLIASTKLLAAIQILRKGFIVISDISSLISVNPSNLKIIHLAQKEVIKKGPSQIIRIVDNPIARNQFKTSSMIQGYTATEVKSTYEAFQLIEKKMDLV